MIETFSATALTDIVKRIDIDLGIFKLVAFHRHKNSEVFDFYNEDNLNSFYGQMVGYLTKRHPRPKYRKVEPTN